MKVLIRGHRTLVQPRWRDRVYERLAKLDRFSEKIVKVDFTLTASRHHFKGNELCQIRAKVPRQTIAVQKSAQTMIEAIDSASKVLEKKVHHLWKDIKNRNRHSKTVRALKRGGLNSFNERDKPESPSPPIPE